MPLEIIHMDLCGPMRVHSHGGSRYFATFIDDDTRWCEVRFLRSKNEVFSAFKIFKAMAENLLERKIKYIQTDNGTEYCNKEFDDYLAECGIKRRTTVPYSPQQNGIAERKNRTLIETARCLMLESGVSPSFWAEAVNAANYVRNRCPSRSLDGDTPYRRWSGKLPILSYFKPFGCKVFVLNTGPKRGKFEPRSREGILVGYSDISKGYRVWVIDEKKVTITRDVSFLDRFSDRNDYEEFMDDAPDEHLSVDQLEVTIDPVLSQSPPTNDPRDPLAEEDSIRDDSGGMRSNQDNIEVPDPLRRVAESQDDVVQMNVPTRGPGRPRISRIGSRGRPRKVYNTRSRSRMENTGSAENESTDEEYESAELADVSVKEALSGPETNKWRVAMRSEYKALLKNNTWQLIDKPTDKNILKSRMVLTNKTLQDGLTKKKARLVAKGCSQMYGVDFFEVFSPVVRMSSIRMLMALAVQHGLHVHQLDVCAAYLNGDLDEEIFMEVPQLYQDILEELIDEAKGQGDDQLRVKADKELQAIKTGNKVCMLKKAIYGVKQAGRQWNKKFDGELRHIGLIPSDNEPCCYSMRKGKEVLIVMIYVDDIVMASQNLGWMSQVKRSLMSVFEIKDLGPISHCLGIDFKQGKGKITMSQESYIAEILEKFGMSDSCPVGTPVNPASKLVKPEEDVNAEMEKCPYRNLYIDVPSG